MPYRRGRRARLPQSAGIGSRWRSLPAIILLAAASAGCQDYNWYLRFERPEDFQRVEETAREQHRDLFIFYKDFLDEASNRMHGEVLADNQVGALFQDTVNVLLDQSGGSLVINYMRQYGVTSPPACVLVNPDGTRHVRTGYLNKERFIRFIQQAKSSGSAAAAPAAP